MGLLQEAAALAITAIRDQASQDATDITFVSGRASQRSETVAACIIWPEGNTESRASGGQTGGIINRWQCVFLYPAAGLPPVEARCVYAEQSMRLLRITPYYNHLYIGDLVAST